MADFESPDEWVHHKVFAMMEKAYSGHILPENKCRTFMWKDSAWTCTGMMFWDGEEKSAKCWRLIPIEQYSGESTPYNMANRTYARQRCKAGGEEYVISDEYLYVRLITETIGEGEQGELF